MKNVYFGELKRVFLLSFILLSAHIIALKFYLYWTTIWMDIINHFLGGLLSAMIALLIFKKHKNDLRVILLSVLFVGIVWEIYELLFGLTFTSEKGYLGDTILDIIMDLIGGLSGYLYYKKQSYVTRF